MRKVRVVIEPESNIKCSYLFILVLFRTRADMELIAKHSYLLHDVTMDNIIS